MQGLSYSLGLDASGGIAGLNAMKSALGSFGGAIGSLLPLVGIAGGLGLAGGAAAAFKKSIDEAAKMEGFQVGFKVLLGSAEAAADRMKELAKFAADTPFELPEVAQASRTLQTLTQGALATGAGLTLVGDVASGTQQSFGELATTIGRLYDGLQSGRPVGEVFQRLQELGAISGDTRAQIEDLQKEGAKGPAVWAVAEKSLAHFSGMMAEQSHTWNGLMSTFQDNLNAVFREFGSPILDQIKPILGDAISLTDALAVKAHTWGEEVANAIGFLRNVHEAGNMGEVVGLSLRVGFSDAVDFLKKELNAAFDTLRGGAAGMFSGLSNVFRGLGMELAGTITEAIVNAVKDLSIGGVKIVSPASAENASAGAKGIQAVGGVFIGMGLDELSKTIGTTLAGAISGLTTPADEARVKLNAMKETFDELARLNVEQNGVADWIKGMKEEAGKMLSSSPASGLGGVKTSAISDRFSKIGGFIGGAGGPRGEKAAQDTARNTSVMSKDLQELKQHVLSQKPGRAGTFV